jgi:hypothetical protein
MINASAEGRHAVHQVSCAAEFALVGIFTIDIQNEHLVLPCAAMVVVLLFNCLNCKAI